jgi:DNA-binding transcriptional LysR family regulator
VDLGLGIAILPSIAFEAGRDRGLTALDAKHLFPPSITQIELRRGRYLHGALYDFVAMLAPQWDRVTIDGRMRESDARSEPA